MKEIIESLHLPVGSEYVKHFLIKQGYTYKKKSLYAKEQVVLCQDLVQVKMRFSSS